MKKKYIYLLCALGLVSCGGEANYQNNVATNNLQDNAVGNSEQLVEVEINSDITLKGDVSEKVEINTDYVEKGVIYPDNYYLFTDGEVDTSNLGRYHLTYDILSNDGTLIKELHRYVFVEDTIKPTIEEKNVSDIVYVGKNYSLVEFCTYSDNSGKANVENIQNHFTYSQVGTQKLSYKIIDDGGNYILFEKDVKVAFDMNKYLSSNDFKITDDNEYEIEANGYKSNAIFNKKDNTLVVKFEDNGFYIDSTHYYYDFSCKYDFNSNNFIIEVSVKDNIYSSKPNIYCTFDLKLINLEDGKYNFDYENVHFSKGKSFFDDKKLTIKEMIEKECIYYIDRYLGDLLK